MEIVGRGFIARNLAELAHKHDGVVAFAVGVPNSVVRGEDEFGREAALLYDVVRRCVRERGKLVFFSTASAAMYGGPESAGTEDGPVYPGGAYGRHNLALESVLARSGVDYLVLRSSNLIGSHQRANGLLPVLVNGIRSGTVTVYRGARRDLVDIADMAAVLDRLLALGVSRQVVNVASGVSVPVEHIVGHIERRLGAFAARRVVDPPVPYPAAPVSIAKLRRLLPGVAAFGFGPDYYKRVLDRYVDEYAGAPLPG
ncbi:NAD-dependent epimerase/dehydratase family protein [Sphaerisporangium sp. TRM90804]|uniref:NAD-dependent epimerase/dehydratase family protein n=1 Tax=Sphaerisporangium sp. TRM90804 TaxID=3031113 RepID=UPI0024480EE2|nr:NAD-dependent epimerase/dehydratase family protein [Sphaerisporangium sp. TRM90804]MDH2427200.1 NAD-dependent epimerase/dehydratase family protein [Sphaerisporangium sp. TRM90804]